MLVNATQALLPAEFVTELPITVLESNVSLKYISVAPEEQATDEVARTRYSAPIGPEIVIETPGIATY